jgi:hypothetical protein
MTSKQTLKILIKKYGFSIILILFISNVGLLYAIRMITLGKTCFTVPQVQSDTRCLYILSGHVYEKGSRSKPHKGHTCGMDVTSIIPSFHTANIVKYLDPHYVGDICTAAPIPTNTPTKLPSNTPTTTPSYTPTTRPLATGTLLPTASPTIKLTTTPVNIPTNIPVPTPTKTPSPFPTNIPIIAAATATLRPTASTTLIPTTTIRPTTTQIPRTGGVTYPMATSTRIPTATLRPTVTQIPRTGGVTYPTATSTRIPTATLRPTVTSAPSISIAVSSILEPTVCPVPPQVQNVRIICPLCQGSL